MDAEDDKVGYGRPPKHSRFTKGRSGNPKGRPKGSPNVKTAIRRAVARLVSVKIGKKTVIDAMAHRLVQQALDGNLKAMRELVEYGGLKDEFATATQRASIVGMEDFDLLRRALARHDTTLTRDQEATDSERSLDTDEPHA